MALLVSFSVKKGNEGIGVWLHFGYSLNEEAATSFLSRVILMPVVIPVPVRFRSAALVKNGRNVEFTAFLLFFCFKMFEHL